MAAALAPVFASVGTFMTAGLATGAIATVIGGAIVGAAIGGITAAVMGGNIGKGLLFGAVGGAVMGGIGAWTAPTTYTSGSTLASTATSVSRPDSLAAISGTTAVSSKTVGGGLLSGLGERATAALITTGGQMLMGAFSPNEGDLTEKDKAMLQQQKELAELQARTEKEIAAMKGGGGGGGSDSAKYAADLQLLNAREQRAQDLAIQKEEWSLIEQARQRRAGAVEGIAFAQAQEPTGTQQPTAPGVMSPAPTPIPKTPEAQAPSQIGLMQPPPQEVQVA